MQNEPDQLKQKYLQLLYVLNWLEKVGENIRPYGESSDNFLPPRFRGKAAAIYFDKSKKQWVGMEFKSGSDLNHPD